MPIILQDRIGPILAIYVHSGSPGAISSIHEGDALRTKEVAACFDSPTSMVNLRMDINSTKLTACKVKPLKISITRTIRDRFSDHSHQLIATNSYGHQYVHTSNSIFFFMIEELSLTMLVVANRELATFPPSTEIKV
jgi:hypothetical protein